MVLPPRGISRIDSLLCLIDTDVLMTPDGTAARKTKQSLHMMSLRVCSHTSIHHFRTPLAFQATWNSKKATPGRRRLLGENRTPRRPPVVNDITQSFNDFRCGTVLADKWETTVAAHVTSALSLRYRITEGRPDIVGVHPAVHISSAKKVFLYFHDRLSFDAAEIYHGSTSASTYVCRSALPFKAPPLTQRLPSLADGSKRCKM